MTSEFDNKVFYASLHSAAIFILRKKLDYDPSVEEIAYAINDEMNDVTPWDIHHLAVVIRAIELRRVLNKPLISTLVGREDQKGLTLLRKELRRIGLTI